MENNFNSYDAEIAFFSILVQNPDLIYEVSDMKGYMFSSKPNELLWESISSLLEKGLVPNATLIISNLTSNNKIELVGGSDYINFLNKNIQDKNNLMEFKTQILNSFKAKSFVSSIYQADKDIKDGGDIDSILSRTKDELDSITTVGGSNTVSELKDEVDKTWEDLKFRIENPGLPGLSTGYSNIDLITGGYMPGDLWIIAARPSMGKTALMINSAIRVAEMGHPVLIISMEMTAQKLVQRMLAIKSNISLTDIRIGTLTQKQVDILSDAKTKIRKLPIRIETNFYGNMNSFSGLITRQHYVHGIELVFLDYLQLLAERSNQAVHDLGTLSRTGKLLANKLGIPIVYFSQLNRLVESRDDKRPILSDLRQSGYLEEDADVVPMLYRDEYYNAQSKDKGILEFILRKQRDGAIGTLFMNFIRESNIIEVRN